MAYGRVLRGTWLDPMGYSQDRREDRAVLAMYLSMLDTIVSTLDARKLDWACKVAELADTIKGYGPVRHAHVLAARQQWADLMAQVR